MREPPTGPTKGLMLDVPSNLSGPMQTAMTKMRKLASRETLEKMSPEERDAKMAALRVEVARLNAEENARGRRR